MVDQEALFEATNVTFFDGPPHAEELVAGQLGVNIDVFRQIKDHYRKAKGNIPCRILADICQDIQKSGYIGRLDDSAERLETTRNTVQRWRTRFADNGLLQRHNNNGRYSVDPRVGILMDKDGKVVRPSSDGQLFKF